MYERLQIYIDAGHSTVCDINALLSCGTVMRTPQAEAFGFPNPFIGLVGFSIVVTIGAAIMAGARFKKWFWVCMNIGLAAATAFIMWLWYQTTFQINALCLFCMIVWVMTITLFVRPRSAIFRRVLFRRRSRCVRALVAGRGLRLACG